MQLNFEGQGFVNEDVSSVARNQKSKLSLFKQAKSEGNIAYLSHTKLILLERLITSRKNGPNSADHTRPSLCVGSGTVGFFDSD